MNTDQVLLETFIRDHPLVAAKTLERLNVEEVTAFIDKIPIGLSVQIMSQVQSYRAAKYLELIDLNIAVQFLEKMDVHAADLILRQCDEPFRNNLLNAIPENSAASFRQILVHPANSVGAFMKLMFLNLRGDISVQEAVELIRQEKERRSSQIYVVNPQGKLEGIVKIHDLLTEENTTKLSSIMNVEIPKLFADTNIESVANHQGWYEFQDIPVIDRSDRLIGTLNIKALQNNSKKKDMEVTSDLIETSNALGELYRIGLTGFLQSVSK